MCLKSAYCLHHLLPSSNPPSLTSPPSCTLRCVLLTRVFALTSAAHLTQQVLAPMSRLLSRRLSLQVFALVPPTPRNLSLYASWVQCGAREAGLFLGDECEGVVRLQASHH